MSLNVLIFGQLVDVIGSSNLTIENITDTNQLVNNISATYPALATTKFAIAVDKKIIKENTSLSNNNTVALLPPFSGG